MVPELIHTDLAKIEALQQKRTLAFVNHFVMTNVQFLNNFTRKCEQKLMDFEKKLEKVNATMVLLEARLSSVPEVNTQESQPSVKEPQMSLEHTNEAQPQDPSKKESSLPEPEQTQHSINNSSQQRPEYDRFLKMVQVGVPVQAVKLKVSLEGLDPNVFEEVLGK